jgi:hypothetical protein
MSEKSFPGSSVADGTPRKAQVGYKMSMEVACVLDVHTNPGKATARRKALEDVRAACASIGVGFTHVLVSWKGT